MRNAKSISSIRRYPCIPCHCKSVFGCALPPSARSILICLDNRCQVQTGEQCILEGLHGRSDTPSQDYRNSPFRKVPRSTLRAQGMVKAGPASRWRRTLKREGAWKSAQRGNEKQILQSRKRRKVLVVPSKPRHRCAQGPGLPSSQGSHVYVPRPSSSFTSTSVGRGQPGAHRDSKQPLPAGWLAGTRSLGDHHNHKTQNICTQISASPTDAVPIIDCCLFTTIDSFSSVERCRRDIPFFIFHLSK